MVGWFVGAVITRVSALALLMALSPALALAGQSTYKFAGRGDGPIASPEEAINVFDFEVVAEEPRPRALGLPLDRNR